MSIESRRQLIEQLQTSRGPNHRVLTFVNGFRLWKGVNQTLGTQIAPDSVRICYDHLAEFSRTVPRSKLSLDLFLYSSGGETSVPWRLVSLFREFASEFHVIVPYTAMSAATMICLGADTIVMGRKGELGPIDPSMRDPAILKIDGKDPLIGVEDVSSYVAFVRERCKVFRPELVSRAVEQLASQLGPIGLGKLNRQHAYIRLVGEKLLKARRKSDPSAIKRILRSLIEEVSFHGHAISRKEAKQLGLHVVNPGGPVEESIWTLYRAYETDLELTKPMDDETWLSGSSADIVDSPEIVLGAIESEAQADNFAYRFRSRRIRDIPPNINIQLNFQGALLQSGAVEPGVLQQIAQQAIQQATPAVRAALAAQCPVKEVRREVLNAEWRTVWRRADQA